MKQQFDIALEIVSNTMGLDPLLIKSKKRNRNIVKARQYFIKMVYKKDFTSLKEVGMYLGNRDHSTVIHNLEAFDDHYDTEPDYRAEYENLSEIYLSHKPTEGYYHAIQIKIDYLEDGSMAILAKTNPYASKAVIKLFAIKPSSYNISKAISMGDTDWKIV